MEHLYKYGRWGGKWFVLENFTSEKYHFVDDAFMENPSSVEFCDKQQFLVKKCTGFLTANLFTEVACSNFMAKKAAEEAKRVAEVEKPKTEKKNKYKSCG